MTGGTIPNRAGLGAAVQLLSPRGDRHYYSMNDLVKTVFVKKPLALPGLPISERDTRLEELKELLLDRNYPERAIESAIEKAKGIPRLVALRRVNKKKQSKRPVFAITFDPRLPSL